MFARPARCEIHPETLTSTGCAVCGRAVCPACDRGDRYVSLCEAHREVKVVQGWAEAIRMHDDAEAELAAGSLRAAGLDANVLSQKDHAHMLSMAGMAVVRVLVPAGQYEDARDVLRAADEAHGAEST